MRLEVKLRHMYEAAQRDRTPNRFRQDLLEWFEEGQIKATELRIRALFEEFVDGGRELVASWRDGGGHQMQLLEAAGSVNTGMFQFLTGNIVYQTMLEKWNSPEFIGDSLVTTVPTELAEEDIPGVSNFGDESEIIGEGEEYPSASLSEELVRMPRIQKRGLRVEVTQEIVAYDRSGLVIKQAGEIAESLRVNKEKRILDVVCGIVNNYIRNEVASNTYQSSGSYINFKTTNGLIDWKNVDAAEDLFNEMRDPNTGEAVTTVPKAMLVPSKLKNQAKMIIRSTAVSQYTGANSTLSAAVKTEAPSPLEDYQILSSPLVKQRTSSDSTWFMGDFQKAFVYREKRKLQVEPMPVGEDAWKRDLVAGWKASEWGSCGVLEPRHAVKSTQ